MRAYGLGQSMAFYVTRPHGRDKVTTSWEMSCWMILLALALVWSNIVAWGAIGLYEAYQRVF